MKNRIMRRLPLCICALLASFALLWGAGHVILAKDNTANRVTIIYTNDTLGSLKPCGCGGRNTGGLPRRSTYIKSVLAENPNTIIVESGDLAFAVNPSEPTAQLEAVVDCLKAMGYTAVGVGPIDLRLGEDYYKVLSKKGLPVVHIGHEKHENVKSYIIKRLGGVDVGIVSFGAIAPEKRDDFELMKKRYDVFANTRKSCDVLILLDQGNVATDEWLERNSAKLGYPDIVIGGGSRVSLSEPKWIGKTMIVPTSTQGTFVGRVDVEVNGKEKKMVFSRTMIDKTIQEDPDIVKIVDEYYKSQGVSISSDSSSSVDGQQPYYPYQSCVSCHPSQYEQWRGTRHAKAISTLLKQERAIPDCLPCHSEMYKRQRRVVVNSDQLNGVECMSCHSNVLPHGSDNKKKVDSEFVKAQCAGCHTPERSAGFDLKTAYEKVKHTNK